MCSANQGLIHDKRGEEHQAIAARNWRRASPAGLEVVTLTDLTTAINASVDDVEFELILTIGLVVMVIFVFLRSLSDNNHTERGRALVSRSWGLLR